MDFKTIANSFGEVENSYACQTSNGNWVSGTVSADFLNTHFGKFNNATDMKKATTSEGLQLFFDDLVNQGKLQA